MTGCVEPDTSQPRANAAFVVLARNKELDGVIQSIKSIERHFNRWYHYPYVFLNDGDFNSTFIETVQNYTSGDVEFGKVGPDMWGYPDWVDEKVAKEGIAKQGDAAVMYGGMESYHFMCRFYSGYAISDLMRWVVVLTGVPASSTSTLCSPSMNGTGVLNRRSSTSVISLSMPHHFYLNDHTAMLTSSSDPFLKMIENNKTYGFTIAVKELRETVPNIFRYASAYKRLNNIKSQGLWEMFVDPIETKAQDQQDQSLPEEVLRADPKSNTLPNIDGEAMEGEKYNMCHFWSNFEIAKLSWFRSKEYNDFFEMMDRSGGFWMERVRFPFHIVEERTMLTQMQWGDAPIHSLAAGILLGPKDVHYFRDFGYRHTTIQHCPANAPSRQLAREPYLEMTTLDEKERFEEDDYWEHWDQEKENGVGCRCRCDTDIVDVEGKEGSCLAEWVDVVGGWAD